MTSHNYLTNLLIQQTVPDSDIALMQKARQDIEGKLRQYIGWTPRFYYGGSYGKRTMIKASYDLDLATYFPMTDNRSIKDLYSLVHIALSKSDYLVKPKTVALHLPYYQGFYIDVVPARARDDEYKYATLYKNGYDSYMQTSLKIHIESVRPYREIIKLMKLWKIRHGLQCKTFVIEQLVRRALGNTSVTDYAEAFLDVLNFTATCMDSVKLIDPANTNNVIDIDQTTRALLKDAAYRSTQQQYWSHIVW